MLKYILYLYRLLNFFQYEENDEVVLWMNTVGPYHNRQETYAYYSLPFCTGTKETISHYHETLGEALQGVELEFSGLDIEYKGKTGSSAVYSAHLSNLHIYISLSSCLLSFSQYLNFLLFNL